MNPLDPEHPEEVAPLVMKKLLTSEEKRCIVLRLSLLVKPDNPDMNLGRGVITSKAQFYICESQTKQLGVCGSARSSKFLKS